MPKLLVSACHLQPWLKAVYNIDIFVFFENTLQQLEFNAMAADAKAPRVSMSSAAMTKGCIQYRYLCLFWEYIATACDILTDVNYVKCKYIFYGFRKNTARICNQIMRKEFPCHDVIMPLTTMLACPLPWCHHAPCNDVIIPFAMMSSCPLPWCHHAPCHDVIMPLAMMASCTLPWCHHVSCHEVIMPLAMMSSCPLPWCHNALTNFSLFQQCLWRSSVSTTTWYEWCGFRCLLLPSRLRDEINGCTED